MEKQTFEISFDTTDTAEASRLATELQEQLQETKEAEVSLKKARPDSQDFGTTLVLVLGTPVAISLAKAIGIFLQRYSGATITISKNGDVIGKNLDSRDASRIAEAFAAKSK